MRRKIMGYGGLALIAVASYIQGGVVPMLFIVGFGLMVAGIALWLVEG